MTDREVKVLPIDLGYMGQKEAAAAYLVTQGETRCLVESGPASCLKQLMAGLESAGLSKRDLNGLILTHIHLDHAGASGYLTSDDCHAHVHPRGARHLIDPERLNASALRVFGAQLESELGVMKPNQSNRVHEVSDGTSVSIGTLTFKALETPGHAKHHHAWILKDGSTSHVFCGDAAGMRIPGTEFPTIPMVPPEFDLEAWQKSLDLLQATGAETLWLTHYGRTTIDSGFLDSVRIELNAEVDFLRDMITNIGSHLPEEHRAWHRKRARAYGVSHETLGEYCQPGFYRANYDGVSRWLSR